LDKLEEAIMLQSELLELQANPDRSADGVVIEAKVERGRGSVATVLGRLKNWLQQQAITSRLKGLMLRLWLQWLLSVWGTTIRSV